MNSQRVKHKGKLNGVEKYLLNYAEPECAPFVEGEASLPPLNKCYCVVIPAYKESPQFISRLLAHPDAHKLLLIVVVNQPFSATQAAYDKNSTLWYWLQQQGPATQLNTGTGISLIETPNAAIVCVDRFTKGRAISEEHGVGLARKLGADLAVALFNQHAFSHPVVFSTDADARLPSNYFDAQKTANKSTFSAWVYDYTHHGDTPEADIALATQSYEQAIKYYREGLAWAGSAYGFHTLGSTLAVSIPHYCQVRGFPKRPAGEDFYLLNKLAKVANVKSINDCTVSIEARASDRVPFGTGPAAQKIVSQWHNNQEYAYYHPQCFILLKSLLAGQAVIWRAIQSNNSVLFTDEQLSTADQTLINTALEHLTIKRFIAHVRKQTRDEKQFRKQFHDWFDGFLTLKFIRFISANKYHDLPLSQCIAGAPFYKGKKC